MARGGAKCRGIVGWASHMLIGDAEGGMEIAEAGVCESGRIYLGSR
jgi:hypothetical protein